MKLLYFLADTFINTFGITRPDKATRRTAAFFILALCILVLVGVGTTAVLLHNAMR